MNSIKVWGINKECDTYDISIETSESVSPAMLHTTARLMEGLGCTVSITSASTTKEQTMSSEKPFWEGKTCKEMAGLHVKVTYESGATLEGVTNAYGDITKGDAADSIRLSPNRLDCPFVPYSFIDSIELVDDLEYERVDNIENVQVGDIFVANDGNQYLIDAEDKDDKAATFRAYLSYAGEMWLSNCAFAYALRRKPKLPDHDGLWWDKDNALWSVAISGMDDSKLVALLIGDPESPITRSVWSGLNSKHVTSQSPFRPAKVVEA